MTDSSCASVDGAPDVPDAVVAGHITLRDRAMGLDLPVYNCVVAAMSVETLQKMPLFGGLDKKELEIIAALLRERRIAAGATVTREGDPGVGFFIVEDGAAEVTVEGAPVGSIGPGDYFGEVALLTGSDRTATIVATTDMLCYGMTSWDFRPLVESNPTIALKLRTAMAERSGSSST